MENINPVELILAIGGLSALIGTFLQHIQVNKKLKIQRDELELKYTQNKEDINRIRDNMSAFRESVNRITGVMYDLLYSINADRIYIVQPHPLYKTVYMSVYFEVEARGVTGVKESFNKLPIQDYMISYEMLKNNDFLIYNNVKDVEDVKIRSMVSYNGGKSLACKRLKDAGDRYVGSLVCEWTDEHFIGDEIMNKKLQSLADEIQYCIPPIADEDKINC